ncbi:sensor domain-containing diguanylate cyclase [Burkholderia sp. BCC1644]|uniref:sensor domain-containing diguanylate cyclase n=1 Tax=Burkholderia sp. BCC1644 TaxID=2676293 RepID=UPI001FC7F6F4|nr:sensor domain-containing diguanylate cyclase [Burkholderia sp. BCC1644]
MTRARYPGAPQGATMPRIFWQMVQRRLRFMPFMANKDDRTESDDSTGLTSTLWQALTASSLVFTVSGTTIALIMVSLCAVVLYESRQDALDHTRETLRNIAVIAQRDIERNLDLYELSLQAVVDGLQKPEVMALPSELRRGVLFDRAATAKHLGSVLVLDKAGNIIFDAANNVPRKGNFSDRPYFTVQRDNPHIGLYISDPYQSRLRGGKASIALSRRLSHPDGSFAGIVLMAINIDYFHELFSGLSLGPHGSMALIGKNGVMIMRQPYDPRIIGRDISTANTFQHFIAAPQGSFSERASIDETQRLYWFQNFPNAPLILMVAAGEQDIYAAWRRRAITIGSLMLAFAGAFITLSALFGVQLRRRIQAESELRLLARTDGLTGLSNRRSFGEILEREWRRAIRTRSVLSLLFVDIDRFKSYNDTYGHQSGDDVLVVVAKCISDNVCRPTDTAARYGGEEFVIVLPDTSASGATEIAEKIRRSIFERRIEHAGSEYGRVTASIGVVSRQPQADDESSVVIKAADEALYHAKSTGRNKVSGLEGA